MKILIALFISFPLFAQTAPTNEQVQIDANFTNLQFGKPYEIRFTAPTPITQVLSVETDEDNTPESDRTSILSIDIQGSKFRIEAASYSIDPYPFPALFVTALDNTGATNQFYTPSFQVPMSNENVLAANTSNSNNNLVLADIVAAPFVWNHLWTILIGAFVLVLLGIFLLTHIKRRAPVNVIPSEDPLIALERRLKSLNMRKNTLNKETYKEFFVELSETCRGLLNLSVAPMAMESPTREILDFLKKHRVSEDLFDAAKLILRTCDAAKYAKATFPQERTDEAIEATISLFKQAVESSKQKDVS